MNIHLSLTVLESIPKFFRSVCYQEMQVGICDADILRFVFWSTEYRIRFFYFFIFFLTELDFFSTSADFSLGPSYQPEQ